ncbi:hypothetical protein HanRHA438_Chr07g0326071 [Helianthus annuus]|nr:hypothetical protein HanRHA438_Chr07g0326071 [Helianthus annuus]
MFIICVSVYVYILTKTNNSSRTEPSGPLLMLGSFTNRTEQSGSFTTERQIERAFSEQFPNERRASDERRAI